MFIGDSKQEYKIFSHFLYLYKLFKWCKKEKSENGDFQMLFVL